MMPSKAEYKRRQHVERVKRWGKRRAEGKRTLAELAHEAGYTTAGEHDPRQVATAQYQAAVDWLEILADAMKGLPFSQRPRSRAETVVWLRRMLSDRLRRNR
jgi:hypothetical protein